MPFLEVCSGASVLTRSGPKCTRLLCRHVLAVHSSGPYHCASLPCRVGPPALGTLVWSKLLSLAGRGRCLGAASGRCPAGDARRRGRAGPRQQIMELRGLESQGECSSVRGPRARGAGRAVAYAGRPSCRAPRRGPGASRARGRPGGMAQRHELGGSLAHVQGLAFARTYTRVLLLPVVRRDVLSRCPAVGVSSSGVVSWGVRFPRGSGAGHGVVLPRRGASAAWGDSRTPLHGPSA